MATATPTRRPVQYAALDDIVFDARRAVGSQAGTTGKWSLGQIIEHLATANDKLIDGFGFSAPWPLPIVGRVFFKNRLLTKGMSPGFNLNPKAAAILVPKETIDAAAALEHLRESVERLKTEQKSSAHPFLGPLTVKERDLLCLRHAELHMSFVKA
jgi:hypothetical protein